MPHGRRRYSWIRDCFGRSSRISAARCYRVKMDSIMVRMETIIHMINEEKQGLVCQKEKEIEKVCRICFDEDKHEDLVSPCYCVGSQGMVHLSCLERWLSLSKRTSCDVCRYEYKTVEHKMSLFEYVFADRSVREVCQDFSPCVLIAFVWGLLVLMCALKAFHSFMESAQKEAFYDAVLLTIITIIMVLMLFWWILLFQTSEGTWWKAKTVVRLKSIKAQNAVEV